MSRIKTFTNGGSLLPADLDSIEDDYEVAFGTYKHLRQIDVTYNAGITPGVYQEAVSSNVFGLYLNPARYWGSATTSSVNPRTVFYNMAFYGYTSATAPAVTFTAGLYAVTSIAGGALTLSGSPVAGSTAAIANPAANTLVPAVYSGDFTAPAAGYFVIAVAVSGGTTAAGSSFITSAVLQMRQV